MKVLRLAVTLGALFLVACQMRGDVRPLSADIAPPPRFAEATPESCLAAESRFAFGRTITAPLLEELRERAGARLARTVQVADKTDTSVDANRLSIDIEPSGRIVGAHCG